MELTQLRYFLAAARFENFTRAAESLFITQPTLSKSVAALEAELGLELFDRNGKTIQLNNYGRAYRDYVQNLFLELDEQKQKLHDMSGGIQGTVTIAFTFPDNEPSRFCECINLFMRKYENAIVRTCKMSTIQTLAAFQSKTVDMAISLLPPEDSALEWKCLFQDRLGIIVPPSHRLAGQETVRITDLKDEWFVGSPTYTDTFNITKMACTQGGFEPKIAFEGDYPAYNTTLVYEGRGISLVSDSRFKSRKARNITQVPGHQEDNVFVLLDDPPIYLSPGVVIPSRRYMTSAAKAFLNIMLDYFQIPADENWSPGA